VVLSSLAMPHQQGDTMGVRQSEIEIIVSKCVEATIIAFTCLEGGEDKRQDLEAKLCDVVRDELTKAGVHVQRKRQATVSPASEGMLSQIRNYLPSNYEAFYEPCVGESVVPYIVIEGYDRAGWTLDDYVIPRLASGLIVAKETTGR